MTSRSTSSTTKASPAARRKKPFRPSDPLLLTHHFITLPEIALREFGVHITTTKEFASALTTPPRHHPKVMILGFYANDDELLDALRLKQIEWGLWQHDALCFVLIGKDFKGAELISHTDTIEEPGVDV